MSNASLSDAHRAWLHALGILTGSAAELTAWQEQRYRFAHRLGELLTVPHAGGTPVNGPVVYGVQLPGVGLSYVGQTLASERRLRDLAVGESHHVGNTVPPEIWERVIVVQWPQLLGDVPEAERALAEQDRGKDAGLALEYRLQRQTRPLLNDRRRTHNGEWRLRNLEDSRSRGARAAGGLPTLFGRVWETWRELSTVAAPQHGDPVLTVPAGRVVFPSLIV
ncbi:hypothetical protein AB0O69_12405 [Streptomyces xiamenensis]|uniref:hypothetical protein n=1 Tax=Streptomyces TaxID=1883 RepID=UPI001907AA9D|nr:hypothetical protein [Streptomyces sp. XC 2026]QQN79042.1 hypothetical protein IPZ77_17580 [Streptomyces sp. XC 2026]